MKKLFYLAFLTPVIFCQATVAQQRFSDAEINYTVDVDPGPSGNAAANFEGSTLVYNFKNYLFRSEMNIGQTTYTNIHNDQAHSALVLIDAGPNKYMIKMNESQLKKEDAKYQGIVFSDAGETKKIAGYDCKKALGKLQDGSSFIVYYTPDLMPENQDYSERFKGLKGLPLEFIMTTHSGVKMTMTATKVTVAPQPSALFATPTSGYRLLTYDELQSMRNRH